MMTAFASVEDLKARWPDAPTGKDSTIEVLLSDAGIAIRTAYPAVGEIPCEPLWSLLTAITCAMVKRALLSDSREGLESFAETADVFSRNLKYSNPDGNLFLTRFEKDQIEKQLEVQAGSAPTAVSMTAHGL